MAGVTSREQQHVARLREEQLKAIEETKERIQKLENFAEDYRTLQTRLSTLPDKVSHEIMVPFGKFGFMPGQLIHTNEVLVLLGDNWFAERSAKQAGEIAGRRIDAIQEQIDKLEQQKGLLEPRLEFSEELGGLLENQNDLVEIKEEYDEEQEKKWIARHRENVRRQKAKKSPADSEQSLSNSTMDEDNLSDSALWSRLEELERQERHNREMIRDTDSDDIKTKRSHVPTEVTTVKDEQSSIKRGVKWKDLEREMSHQSTIEDTDETSGSSDEDQEADNEDNNGYEPLTRPTTIVFKHSNTNKQTDTAEMRDDQADTPDITSPADIYKRFVQPARDGPKSILKNVTSEVTENAVASRSPTTTDENPVTSRALNEPEPFSGKIIEKAPTSHTEVPMAASSSSHSEADNSQAVSSAPPPKRVSRFKAQRLQKQS